MDHNEITGSGHYYYLFDGLGSVMAVTNSSGAVAATYAYDPYGNQTSSTGSLTNPYRYASGYLDSATGYLKFGIRYYDPKLGRWTQQDPVGGSLADPSTGNRYTYTGGDPINLADPGGAVSTTCVLAGAELGADLALSLAIGFGIIPGGFAFVGTAIGAAALASSLIGGNGSAGLNISLFGADIGTSFAGLLPGLLGVGGTVLGIGFDVFAIYSSCGS